MIVGFRAILKANELHLPGLDPGVYEVIDYRAYDDDILVITKCKGKKGWSSVGMQSYYPTRYELSRLVPISEELQSFNGKMMSEFEREVRPKFSGHYRVEEIFMSITPGRHRGMVRELQTLLARHALGRVPKYKKIIYLDGIKIGR